MTVKGSIGSTQSSRQRLVQREVATLGLYPEDELRINHREDQKTFPETGKTKSKGRET